MKGGTLYLANTKWQGRNPRPKKMSTSQGKHPTSGRLSRLQCRGKSHCGTPDISHGSSRTVSDSNYPPYTHRNTTYCPSYTQSVAFLVSSSPSLNLQSFLTTLSHSSRLHSPSANFLTQPEHSSSPLPITQYSPTALGAPAPLHPPQSPHHLAQPLLQFKPPPSFHLPHLLFGPFNPIFPHFSGSL